MNPNSNKQLRLHPKSYLELRDPLIFYISSKTTGAEKTRLYETLKNARLLVVTGYRTKEKTWAYNLHVGDLCLSMRESFDKETQLPHYNFGLLPNPREDIARRNLYHSRPFTIIPSGSAYILEESYSKEERKTVLKLYDLSHNESDSSWHMDDAVYDDLIDKMEAHFESEEEEGSGSRHKVSGRFERNVLKPFRDYTAKENWAEEYRQSQGDCISYDRHRPRSQTEKGAIYDFYSTDPRANPEDGFFSVGDRLSIVSDGGSVICSGILNSIDDESAEAVIYTIAFFRQFNYADLPKSGRLMMAVNDTQTRVRSNVIRKLERDLVESKYMYRTFSDFSTEGYEEPPEDLAQYLAQEMEDQYPPNQMQLEAIIKGILTKDVLLVLGPPGTGKTTVISKWVKYFLRQGKRVLISSQNNAAVDNVLARFAGKGEIVRLGNEDKVQENCKQFLPHNKLDTISREFNKNQTRVQGALARDKESIAEYRRLLESYADKMEVYSTLNNQCTQLLRQVGQGMAYIQRAWNKYLEAHEGMQKVQEKRAHKQLFLEEAEKKNFFVRLLIRPYVKNVRSQLRETDAQLQKHKTALADSMKTYNAVVQVIRTETDKLRSEDMLKRRRDIRLEVEGMLQQHFATGMQPLQLCSEVASCYQTPAFSKKPEETLRIVLQEMQEMERLETIIRKTEAALGDWYAAVEGNRNDIFQNVLLETCQIVGATCIGINSNRDFTNVKFDVSIVDESGQIQVHNALIPMSRAPKNLLLGDYKQIPPCANDLVVEACRQDDISTELLNKSFFEYLFENMRRRVVDRMEKQGIDSRKFLQPVLADYQPEPYQKVEKETVQQMIEAVVADEKKLVNLNSQFRMPGDISDVISRWFYEDNYFSSYNMKRFAPMVPGTGKPLVVISTSRCKDRRDAQPENKQGYFNNYEADLVAELVARVIENQPEEKRREFCEHIEDNIGIISAYGAQVRTIREKLKKHLRNVEPRQINSMVASLDSFQGQERPLIIYSLTRSTKGIGPNKGRVGFMKELRRLNVAFTRCQMQLVIVGDIDYLCWCMNTQQQVDEEGNPVIWPCQTEEAGPEQTIVEQAYIDQCAQCPAACERKFARFMRLLMQHVRAGNGELLHSINILREQTTK